MLLATLIALGSANIAHMAMSPEWADPRNADPFISRYQTLTMSVKDQLSYKSVATGMVNLSIRGAAPLVSDGTMNAILALAGIAVSAHLEPRCSATAQDQTCCRNEYVTGVLM